MNRNNWMIFCSKTWHDINSRMTALGYFTPENYLEWRKLAMEHIETMDEMNKVYLSDNKDREVP